MKAIALALGLALSVSAHASLVTLSPEKVNMNGYDVAAGGTVKIADADVALTTVAAGMRKKYLVPFFGTDVYVASFMVNAPAALVKSPAGNETLASLEATQTVAIVKMDFARYVTADQIFTAFTDALKVNGVDTATPELTAFVDAIKAGGDADVGQSMTFLLAKNADGSETLTYENPKGGVSAPVTGAAGLSKNILSMYFGEISPSDKGLKELKDQLNR
jgi:hypothetical protein